MQSLIEIKKVSRDPNDIERFKDFPRKKRLR